MLRNIFVKTLWDYRRQIFFWGGGLFLIMVAQAPGYNALFSSNTNPQDAAKEIQSLADSFSILFGKAYDLDTFGGFTTMRTLSFVPVVVGLFAVIMGSAIIRGEEERGALDMLLSTPHSRTSVLLQKWAGLVVVTSVIGILCALGMIAGVASTGGTGRATLDYGAAFVALLGSILVGLVFGTLALMLSQFMSRGSALGVAGGFLAASYLLNNLTVNARDLEFIRYILPLYYESQSKPLARSVGVNWGSLSVLLILVIPLLALAWAMYLRRDHNGYFNFGRTSTRPAAVKTGTSFSLWRNSPFLFSLRSGLISAAIWGTGLSLYTFMMVSAIPGIRNDIMRLLQSDLYRNINIPAGSSDTALVNMLLFTTGLMVFVAFAIMRVASWSSEENNGRLEMLLSTPQSRWKMLLSYFAAALVSLAALVAIVWLALLASAAVAGLTLDNGKVAAGFIGLWILCGVVIGAGYILTAFGPGWAVAAVSGLVVVSYVGDLFGNFLKLPEAITNLSIFKHFNYPLLNGLNWTTQTVFGAITLGFIAVALWNFRRRDIQK